MTQEQQEIYDIVKEGVEKLKGQILELTEERDMLASENENFANFLELQDYSLNEIDNIANNFPLVKKQYIINTQLK